MRGTAAVVAMLVWTSAAMGQAQAPTAPIAPAAAPPPQVVHTPPPPAVISNPAWERTPAADAMSDFYPAAARDAEVNGRTRILCDVLADGRLSDCTILEEFPTGYGFGRAALQASRYFKMRPFTVSGEPVTGGHVMIPVNWKVFDREVLVETPGLPVRPMVAIARDVTYPEAVRDSALSGEVWVRGTVATDGSVANATVKDSSRSPELDQAAVAAFQQWRFAPAEDAQRRPVESVVAAKFTFDWEPGLDVRKAKCRHLTLALDRFSKARPDRPLTEVSMVQHAPWILTPGRRTTITPDALAGTAKTCAANPEALFMDVLRKAL